MSAIVHGLYQIFYNNQHMHHGKKVLLGVGVLGVWAGVSTYKWWRLSRTWRRMRDGGDGMRILAHRELTGDDLTRIILSHYPPVDEAICERYEPKPAADAARRLAELCASYKKYVAQDVSDRILEVSCYAGRTAFELCQHFKEVVAIDSNKRLIHICKQLLDNMTYELDISNPVIYSGDVVSIMRPQTPKTSSLTFHHLHVTDYHVDAGKMFGLVIFHAIDVDHVTFTNKLLHCARDLVAVGGALVVVTPHTWYKKGKPVKVYLSELLTPSFELKEETDLSMVMRQTSRIFSYIVSHVSLWKRLSL